MPEALLGIDLGTTLLKMGLFDRKTGKRLAEAARSLPVGAKPRGARSIPLPGLMRAFGSAAKELRAQAPRRWQDIAGIGLAAQGGSSIIADRASGRPDTPMMLWNDERCHAQVRALGERHDPSLWRGFVGYAVPPTGLGRLAWLQESQPSLFTDAKIHVGAGEYLFFRMTGSWRQDAGNAIQIGSYHAGHQRLQPELLALIGLPLDFVAPLREGHKTVPLNKAGARLLGLAEGIPVAGPYLDQEAGYMAVMQASRSPLHCSLGTAWVGNFCVPSASTWDSPTQMLLPPPRANGRFVVQALPTGNMSWDWALRTLLHADLATALRKSSALFRRQLLPAGGIACIPWFTQGNPLLPAYSGGGVLTGLNADTDPAELLRAVAAGLVFELHRFLGQLVEEGTLDAVVIGGGASKGMHFRTLIAGVFDPAPVYWQTHHDLGPARGALYAFDSAAAKSSTERVPRLTQGRGREIRAALGRYVETFGQVYGPAPEERGYRL